jgi:hypothetical protein
MYVPFRQGLVRLQVDSNSNPAALQKVSGGQFINLVVSPTPTIINFAFNDTDYLFEETVTVTHAWGPFTGSNDQWLYWDIDPVTAVRTFGYTSHEPKYLYSAPTNPATNQHWFDLTNTLMNYWNGSRWVPCIRCFAAKYDNSSVIIPYLPGSQAGINVGVNSGFILFDDDEKPIKKWQRDNKGQYLTTESPIISHLSRVSNVVLEGATDLCIAKEAIPQWSVVAYQDYNTLVLASYLDQTKPAAGIVKWNMNIGDQGIIHSGGYITNNNWNWTVPASTPLFVGASGQITTVVPQTGSIQRIGMVVDSDTIYVSIEEQVILDQS